MGSLAAVRGSHSGSVAVSLRPFTFTQHALHLLPKNEEESEGIKRNIPQRWTIQKVKLLLPELSTCDILGDSRQFFAGWCIPLQLAWPNVDPRATKLAFHKLVTTLHPGNQVRWVNFVINQVALPGLTQTISWWGHTPALFLVSVGLEGGGGGGVDPMDLPDLITHESTLWIGVSGLPTPVVPNHVQYRADPTNH